MATQVAQGAIVRVRGESPERWQMALQRAFTVGLEVFRLADSRELVVSSASQFDLLHRTDGERCTCEAARHGDPVCTHRAVARFVRGLLDAPASTSCAWCAGAGWVRDPDGANPPEPCSCPIAAPVAIEETLALVA
jgi:hypothetical protein